MTKEHNLPDDLFYKNHEVVGEALREAVTAALKMHKRLNNPIAVWQDNQVVIIPAKDIPVDINDNEEPG